MVRDVVAQRVAELPASCIDDVLHYIDLVCVAYKNEGGEDGDSDISEFFGSVRVNEDPLFIQRRLRDEWQ